MDIFNLLTMVGGLSLFLFGMDVMGQALERRAGNSLRELLGKMTTGRIIGLLTGIGVTAVIQSSSAATVMVIGFVNSGLMTLRQAINVIMGANIGTTLTAWVLSLAGIDSGSVLIRLLKPTSFTPVLAVIGVVLYLSKKNARRKDTGTILLGFATLMFGMETMSGAVSGLSELPGFQTLFLLFENPLLGVIAGALLTAAIQSSTASVGILQALAVTGQIRYGAAIPIIMGQNIGTCVTAMLSSVGATRNAKRAAMVHLSFNVIGAGFWLVVFWLGKVLFAPPLLDEPATLFGIAAAHSAFNLLCMVLVLPLSGWLERLVCRLVPDDRNETQVELDERLFATPPLALGRCYEVTADMARCAVGALEGGLTCLTAYDKALAERVREDEERSDHYEDILGTYLLRLSTLPISEQDSSEAAKLLRIIGDFERISDHAVNLVESAEELRGKELMFSEDAVAELTVLSNALREILGLSLDTFLRNDPRAAMQVEPLEQVIDSLKEQLRLRHIRRMQQGVCSIEQGFVWSDLLTDLERVADHCSNIAGCVTDLSLGNLNLHESLRAIKQGGADFDASFAAFAEKYALPAHS